MTADLTDRLAAGDHQALARAISWVENGLPEGRRLLDSLAPRVGRAVRVGLTGPPGVGKSTLVDALAAHWTAASRHVAVLAVDPTSPFTGGALLGDRVRMGRASEGGAVFIRSMATRGAAGGLARAASDALDLLDASGADALLVETVGAGQAEVEVARCTDAVLLLLSPESGDAIQAMKSGLMEIADLVVINKADRPGADRLEAEVRQALDLSTRDRKSVPILRTEAFRGGGVPEVAAALDLLIASRRTSGAFDERRRDNLRARIRAAAEFLVRERLFQDGEEGLAALADRVGRGELSPYAAADTLVRRMLGDSR